MKSLKESLLDTEENLYNRTIIAKISPHLSILETIHKRIIKNDYVDLNKLSSGATDACGQKLNIGDLVIFPNSTSASRGSYQPENYIMVGVVVKLVQNYPGGPHVQLLLTNDFNEEVQKDIEHCVYSTDTCCVYCGQCMKIHKSFIQNLYK